MYQYLNQWHKHHFLSTLLVIITIFIIKYTVKAYNKILILHTITLSFENETYVIFLYICLVTYSKIVI